MIFLLTLSEIRDWCKTFSMFDAYYIGRLDAKKSNSLGVYSRDTPNRACLGGTQNQKYIIKSVSFLIHGTTNKNETEQLAQRFYTNLRSMQTAVISGCKVYYIKLIHAEPIDVDADSSKVYEYVVQADFYYEKYERQGI